MSQIDINRLLKKFGSKKVMMALDAMLDYEPIDRLNLLAAILVVTLAKIPDLKAREKLLDKFYDLVRAALDVKFTDTKCVICDAPTSVIEGTENDVTICPSCMLGSKRSGRV